MSKRKRRRRHQDRSGQSEGRGERGAERPELSATNRMDDVMPSSRSGSRSRNQADLLVLALVLLVIAGVLNWQRMHSESLPPAVDFPEEPLVVRPLTTPSSGDGRMFTELPATRTNIDMVHPISLDHPQAYLYFSSPASGGTAIGDVNGDGRPDLFIASGPGRNRLYLQTEEPFRFVDATATAGVDGGEAWGCGATMVDVNADGRLDIFVANYDAPNQLFINLGDGRFRDDAIDYGLNITDASLEGVFADYDGDSWLDLYLLTYRYENPDGMPLEPPIVEVGGQKKILEKLAKFYEVTNDSIGYGTVGRSDGLLRNNGDGTFSDVTEPAGIYGPGHGQSATWWDFNLDGHVDLHVGNDFNDPDRLYRNNGDGTFTDVIREAVPHVTWFSMGADFGDLNEDGLPDLLSSDMSSTTHFKQKTTMGSMGSNIDFLTRAVPRQYMRNALLLGTGTTRFREAAYLTGLDSTDWTWSVKLGDFDCDGRNDVFITNGSVRSFTDSDRVLTLSERRGKTEWDLYKDTEPLREKNMAFRNDGNLNFTDVGALWGVDKLGVSMSSAYGDLDGDGDLDLVVANIDEPVSVYRNDSQQGTRLTIRLHGLGGNRFGVGARVKVNDGKSEQIAEMQPSRGFLASNQPIVHFAFSDAKTTNVEVTWPGGHVQRFDGVATNQHLEITEVRGSHAEPPASVAPMFETRNASPTLNHIENEFDDYARQPLLPHRMSRLGRAMASGDFDGDGMMDYFLGGAAGQAGMVALSRNGQLVLSEQPALESDRASEDMGAMWLDVDGDGDQDLIVASGGNEHEQGSAEQSLRCYLNSGDGTLVATTDRLPDIRTSCGPLAAADFDSDGDVDLFVGGRQIPGKYPLPGMSYLLVNENGRFVDATDRIASSLRDAGMVTGSIWTDVDNDRDLDLMLTVEWGSVRLFANDAGMLRDATSDAGLSANRGWWTGISGADLDGDGDVDYVVTNLGTNTKYHASDEHPFRLFYGDFEGNGEPRLVEAEYEDGTLFPVRGKSCSTRAIPSLAQKFTTYRDFATASLQEIYAPTRLDESYQVSANWLESAVLLNDGSGRFSWLPLPVDAQLSPCFGAVLTELNGDGISDCLLVQNFFSPQPETGNFDGGLGCVLLGLGDGQFRSVPVAESGVIIPEDGAAVVMTDLGESGVPGFLVATNDSVVKDVANTSPKATRENLLQVVFAVGSSSEVAGAKLDLSHEGRRQTCELHAGSGYLSQQPPMAFFAMPKDTSGTLRVIFVDGSEKEMAIGANQRRIVID